MPGLVQLGKACATGLRMANVGQESELQGFGMKTGAPKRVMPDFG